MDHSTWGTPSFKYPIWPPKAIIDLNHWVGQFDPALLDRPVWWRATIWIDVLVFGPFYAFAAFAYITGKKWIRIPSIMWATMMLTNVTIIMFSEFFDPLYVSNPYWWVVISANVMWIIMAILTLIRIIIYPTTFERAILPLFFSLYRMIKMNLQKFQRKYGSWTLVAGVSQGLGEVFAREIAKKGINVILVARRKILLNNLVDEFTSKYNIQAQAIQMDLTELELIPHLKEQLDNWKVGLLVYNAALSLIGSFLDQSIDEHMQVIDLNCRAVVKLTHYLGNIMRERNHGGIILMSSLTAFQGSPVVAHYGATKAYILNLAEALWNELKPFHIDVKACIAGATATPNFIESNPSEINGLKPKIMSPEEVVKETLQKLHRNKPFIVPGISNKITS
ncbi:MAG: SDR family NAD(P)-dependent oxidoreductase [Candidatus Lokiarchaeota archaeon]|nr:SDR family NAD(P)-dependent oxidoreductase [Candidatus Lokiarchaeota archaeon]